MRDFRMREGENERFQNERSLIIMRDLRMRDVIMRNAMN